MIDIKSLSSFSDSRLVGTKFFHFDKLRSTMNKATTLANHGTISGSVIIAEEQTFGRGRFDRHWISDPFKDILCSIILRPIISQLPFVNMAITLAVAETVEQITNQNCLIKWPNDVLVSGRKLCGVLIEVEIIEGVVKHAIIGIGLNVNTDISRYPEISSTATSISREVGGYVDRTCVLKVLLGYIEKFYSRVVDGDQLRDEWVSKLALINETVEVIFAGERIVGKSLGIDEQGRLLLETGSGNVIPVSAGEIINRINE